MTEIISWVSLGIALFALYHSVRNDKLQLKIEKVRQRGELRKRISFLELDVIPRFKTFYEQAESKCKLCASFHKDDYDLIEWHLGARKKTGRAPISANKRVPWPPGFVLASALDFLEEPAGVP